MSSTEQIKATELSDMINSHNAENASAFLGYKLLSIDKETNSIRIAFNPGPASRNPAGKVQGGMITAMLDDAMCTTVWAFTEGKMVPLSVDIHVQFWRPVDVGQYIAEATLKHMTRSTAFLEGTLFNDANEPVAHGVQTVRLVPVPSTEA